MINALMKKKCTQCRWADIHNGTRVLNLPNNVTVTQSGNTNIVCKKPGGVTRLTVQMGHEFVCGDFEPKHES